MKSRASLLLAAPLLLAAQAPEQGTSGGARATAGNGETAAYDAVGFARVEQGKAMTAAHARLPVGSIAEVTALDSGRITLVQIAATLPEHSDAEIELSQAAAQALGLSGEMDAVRVRSIQASTPDAASLRNGASAAPRLPAPEALLRALRRNLPGLPASEPTTLPVVAAPRRALPYASAAPTPSRLRSAGSAKPANAAGVSRAARPGLHVQVAALRDERRARALASDLGGRVEGAAGLWRIRLGPFADRAVAQRARDAAISRGYGGASIISVP